MFLVNFIDSLCTIYEVLQIDKCMIKQELVRKLLNETSF